MKNSTIDIINNPTILLLTVEQASHILQLGKSTTYELVNNEHCPFIVHRIGKTIRIEKTSLLESLKSPISI